MILTGCAMHDRSNVAPPADAYESFAPVGVPADVRVFGDVADIDTSAIVTELRSTLAGRRKATGLQILALSGGGADGAYGAGVLNGWTQEGSRPEFDLVTGISTGAIIAPFAFLGPAYDEALQRFYTTTNTQRIARGRVIPALLGGGSLARTGPLEAAIARELSDDVLRQVAAEHAKGRRLFVGTTNFDAERPVVWDLGYIAAQGTPEAYALARRVVLASASIPVVFNPVPITVTNGAVTREELHVDGALTQQIFTYPIGFDMRRMVSQLGLSDQDNTVWIIYNNRVEPLYAAQNTRLIGMAERTLDALLRSQGLGDLGLIISLANRDGFDANGIAVPPDFDEPQKESFDPVYMRKLYARGFQDGASGTGWQRDLDDEFANP
ncbi:MAG: patatin-like phospholipase family protein [Pseudomonadota bacterium]